MTVRIIWRHLPASVLRSTDLWLVRHKSGQFEDQTAQALESIKSLADALDLSGYARYVKTMSQVGVTFTPAQTALIRASVTRDEIAIAQAIILRQLEKDGEQ